MNKQSEYYFKPKKLFSQNFLIDQNIAKKIASSIHSNEDDYIIEIGCGTGSLTKYLLEKKSTLIGTEIDWPAIEILSKIFPKKTFPNFILLNQDILQIGLSELIQKHNLPKSYKFLIAGNIPYKISSEIFFWLFHQSKNIKNAILMIQKEVAQRLTANPRTKEYGILTIAMELVGNCKSLFDVPPTCFHPRPDVTSTVIEMTFNKTIEVQYFRNVMVIVRTAFNQRRKTLRNSLMNVFKKKFKSDKEKISKFIFENNDKYFKKRAEELTTEDFIGLYKLINNE
ncbi:MAG: ribosomal RNA small subunit methyltransferase A [Ignavibacteria bacterium GWB2_35_12]|nr:MAG: ribosomal RNA small subunit methyltransferase A [Ignavibacteria bacterium GWA2_35_8]OGU40982.1 MAG: ribosomal RNA small subunit methyltransferase A [Ignavibacteria bacterium GWB2_35_12]OGU91161.1 MAG: ribosomal RNA small subunit methyltransferase A [Ignavibacteria bacterium RIFOXYA2_FULL_35_10]OGV19729.1 MAG: ribosomal RNA small subunit methyltransferase A [Ignavibacteria bacterium RIFOXYC2_FULL_35_21]